MECLGPQCAAMLLEWLRTRAVTAENGTAQESQSAGPQAGTALDGRSLQRRVAGDQLGIRICRRRSNTWGTRCSGDLKTR